VREHYEPLLRFALRLAMDEAEARDLVHDTFERALRNRDALAPQANERSWLHSILHNAFRDRCRRRAVRRTVGDEALEFRAAEPPSEPPVWASISAEQLRVAIEALEPEFQDVYRLHAIESRSYKEIALALGIPTNTVGTRLARARLKLRALLTEASGAQEDER
jgi:RNA polymerase sigma-70 factor (ECF subfamily)